MSNLFMIVDATNKGNFNKLTRHRMPGALPFGAKYRLIDFTLSNCKNSSITNVAIFPYGNYRSLADHIGSGDRWDLNRRKDGIFILPPKNLNLTYDDSISFQRMYEHLEYFTRSTQEYVIVSPASIVWNIDYNVILHNHLVQNAEITEVLTAGGERLRTFVLTKKMLVEFVTGYDAVPYRNLTEVFDYSPNMRRNQFIFESASFYIDGPSALFHANMSILNPEIRNQLFNPNRPIYSKETMSSPSRYGPDAIVKNSMVASGAVVEGTVIHSIIGRKAIIKAGAIVTNSIIMNQSIIESGAKLEYAILDKETHVLQDAIIRGSLDDLFVSEKKQVVANDQDLTVLQIAVECVPFVKTGGLADVVGALSTNLSNLGVVSSVMLPLYPRIKEKYKIFFELIAEQVIEYNTEKYKVSLYGYHDNTTQFYFVESYDFFDRDQVYGYEDDGDRFAFFSKCAVQFLDVFERLPDVIHIHDWHLGLVPLLLKESDHYNQIKTLMTIHNIEYQGVHPSQILERVGIRAYQTGLSYINFMEIGLNSATKISTVSPTYRDELKYEYYSKNLVDLINRRDRDFYGVLNGLPIDIAPETDLSIRKKYDAKSVTEIKPINKHYLQQTMGLRQGDDYFVIGMVGRVVEQKGFDIILAAFDEMMTNPQIQFVLLGVGDPRYMGRLRQLEQRYPERVKMNLAYDAADPQLIYAGADCFLMPSRFEPCGTSQMIALRFGTVPIVRQTGGLNDTIENFDIVTKKGNGFKFYNYDSRDLLFQLNNAFHLFHNQKSDWQIIIKNAMASRFPLEATAKAYAGLYQMML